MTVTIIGYYGAYPPPNGATSGYLIEDGDTRVLLDCGSGLLAKLQERIALSTLDGVVLTHYHHDHVADFGCLQYAVMIEAQLGRRRKPFTAWGPDENAGLAMEPYVQGRSFIESPVFRIGCLTFEVINNVHDIDCYAIKVTDPLGAVLIYTGDTAYNPELAAFSHNVDCLICEASFYEEQKALAKHHMTAGQAGQLAAAAQAKSLILTHLPHYGEFEQLIIQARRFFSGPISIAAEWMEVNLS